MKITLQWQVTIIAAALLVGLWWSHGYYAAQRERAEYNAEELADCRLQAGRIRQLGSRVVRMEDTDSTSREFNRLADQASASAGVPRQNIGNITPTPPRRLGETSYQERPVVMLLRQVSIEQLVRFLNELTSGNGGLQVRELLFTTPPTSGGNQWNVQVTISYLIYSPRETSMGALANGE